MKNTLFLSALLLLPLPAQAAPTPKQAFTALLRCVERENPAPCREKITASSVAWFDRFTSYGLTGCLPKDIQYVSQQKAGSHTIVRASTESMGGRKRFMRFYFVEEEERWKLDVPESLRAGMGEKWEQRVTLTEQLYLAVKAQAGEALSCSSIRALADKS